MRFRLCLALLTLTIPVSSVVAAPKKVHKTARRSVVDYFRLLPSRYFEFKDRSVLLQKQYLPVIDLKNDYLLTSGDAAQPGLQVAVFRYRGQDVVAVSAAYEIGFSFDLLKYENRRWRNVTDDLSPLVSKKNLRFKLPRYGTTIQVYRDNGTHLANLYWEKGRFSAESFDPTGHR